MLQGIVCWIAELGEELR